MLYLDTWLMLRHILYIVMYQGRLLIIVEVLPKILNKSWWLSELSEKLWLLLIIKWRLRSIQVMKIWDRYNNSLSFTIFFTSGSIFGPFLIYIIIFHRLLSPSVLYAVPSSWNIYSTISLSFLSFGSISGPFLQIHQYITHNIHIHIGIIICHMHKNY